MAATEKPLRKEMKKLQKGKRSHEKKAPLFSKTAQKMKNKAEKHEIKQGQRARAFHELASKKKGTPINFEVSSHKKHSKEDLKEAGKHMMKHMR